MKKEKFKVASRRIFRDWPVINNYEHAENERIWISWNPKKLEITITKAAAQGICCQIVD